MRVSPALQKHLKGLAHHLKPVVLLGQKGLTDAVVQELREALAHHELVKIRVSAEDREERQAIIEALCEQTEAKLIQRIGHVAVLFKRNHEKPKLVLPKPAKR